MYDAGSYMKEHKDITGAEIFGLTNWENLYIYDQFYGSKPDLNLVQIASLDLECDCEDGFPNIKNADNEITAITVATNRKKTIFTIKDFVPHRPDITHIKGDNERDMLRKFLNFWSDNYPDVITGWNVEFFDVPYIVNRIAKVLGSDAARSLSPWEILDEKEIQIMGKQQQTFAPAGIVILDYINLYKKFNETKQESYKLDFIAEVELDEHKLDYSEYGNLTELYKKNPQKYFEYNIHDVDLVDMLEDHRGFIKLVLSLSYSAGINFDDALGSVKLWDCLIHSYLMQRNFVIPPQKDNAYTGQIRGAYVKEPKIGLVKWVVGFDFSSLYPHLIMFHNISPEKFLKQIDPDVTPEQILEGYIDKVRDELIEKNATITGNMCLFSKDGQGFLPELMQSMFNERKVIKKKMLACEQVIENLKNNGGSKEEIAAKEKERANHDTFQYNIKICLNSAYGVLSNEYCRYYSKELAEAITTSGQVAIQYVAKRVNDYLNKLLKTNKEWVVYSDTDSQYIEMEHLVQKIMPGETDKKKIIIFLTKVGQTQLKPFIDNCCKELTEYVNASESKLNMALESISDKGIWTAKKKYFLNVWWKEGVVYKEPKLKIKGIEAVRSSTPASCRKSIKEALSIIVNKEEADLQKYVADFKQIFETLPFEKIAFPRGVNGLEKYTDAASIYAKGTPIQVKAALLYNFLLKKLNLQNKYSPIIEGDKVKYCYLSRNSYGFDVIGTPDVLPPEFKLDNFIDRELMFQKAFLDPLRFIMEAIKWETEKKANLEDFFS